MIEIAGDSYVVARTSHLVGRVVTRRRFGIPIEDRLGVAQQSIVSLLRVAKGRALEEDEFGGFVRGVTYRHCIDWARSRRWRERLGPRSASETSPQERARLTENRRHARAVILELRGPCRETIGLHVGLGLTYGQISALLQVDEASVTSRVSRCIRRAGRMLNRPRRR